MISIYVKKNIFKKFKFFEIMNVDTYEWITMHNNIFCTWLSANNSLLPKIHNIILVDTL